MSNHWTALSVAITAFLVAEDRWLKILTPGVDSKICCNCVAHSPKQITFNPDAGKLNGFLRISWSASRSTNASELSASLEGSKLELARDRHESHWYRIAADGFGANKSSPNFEWQSGIPLVIRRKDGRDIKSDGLKWEFYPASGSEGHDSSERTSCRQVYGICWPILFLLSLVNPLKEFFVDPLRKKLATAKVTPNAMMEQFIGDVEGIDDDETAKFKSLLRAVFIQGQVKESELNRLKIVQRSQRDRLWIRACRSYAAQKDRFLGQIK